MSFEFKILIRPDGFPLRIASDQEDTLSSLFTKIKDHLDAESGNDSFRIYHNNQRIGIEDHDLSARLDAYFKSPEVELDLEFISKDNRPVTSPHSKEENKRIELEAEDAKNVLETDISLKSKDFLGGFKSSKTGKIYLNSQTQKVCPGRAQAKIQKFNMLKSRSIQTEEQVTCSTQMRRDNGSQVPRKDLFVDDSSLKQISVGNYVESEVLIALRKSSAIKLQCFYRSLRALRKTRAMKQSHEEVLKTILNKEESETLLKIDKRIKERRKFIKVENLEDLKHVYSTLQHSMKCRDLDSLLEKLEIFARLDSAKVRISSKSNNLNRESLLEKIAQNEMWELSDGDRIEIETPINREARRLIKLMSDLKTREFIKKNWLEFIVALQWEAKSLSVSESSSEFQMLVDREADLMSRGRSKQARRGLRKRLIDLFYDIILEYLRVQIISMKGEKA